MTWAFADYSAIDRNHANIRAPSDGWAIWVTTPCQPPVFALKSSGIKEPSGSEGQNPGAPVFDGSRKAWPLFRTKHMVWRWVM